MKVLLAIFTALTFINCSKPADATQDVKKDHHECKCESKFTAPVWRFGTLCQAGEASQGHGVNKDGRVVSGCVKIDHTCTCPEHEDHQH